MSEPKEQRQDPTNSTPKHVSPMNAEEGYVRVPRWVERFCKEGKITPAQRRLLYEVAAETESWSRGWVKLSNSDLAERVGVSERWVRKCRDDLLERNLLQRRQYGQGYVYGLGGPDQPSREEIREIVGEQLGG